MDFLITSCLCPKHFLPLSCITGPWGRLAASEERGVEGYYLHEIKTGYRSAAVQTLTPKSDRAAVVYFLNHFSRVL